MYCPTSSSNILILRLKNSINHPIKPTVPLRRIQIIRRHQPRQHIAHPVLAVPVPLDACGDFSACNRCAEFVDFGNCCFLWEEGEGDYSSEFFV